MVLNVATDDVSQTFALKSNDEAKKLRQKVEAILNERIPTMPVIMKDWVRGIIYLMV